MDEHQLIAFESDYACAVVGRGIDFVLIPLTGAGPIDEQLCEQAERRCWSYCGLFAVVSGRTRVKCEDAESLTTMIAASGEFARLLATRIDGLGKDSGDFVQWATRLWNLSDTRPEV